MTPFADAIQAVAEVSRNPIDTYDEFPATDGELLTDPAYKNLLTICHSAATADRNAVLVDLAKIIIDAPRVFQASRVAMVSGIVVEWGADPKIAISAILEKLKLALGYAEAVAPSITQANEAQRYEENTRCVSAWKSLRYLVMPAMTMLCLDTNARHAARQDVSFMRGVKSLAANHREVNFLHRLLNLVDGEELLVLHPQENKGFRVRLEAIATNYHLFSLLQGVLVGDGKLSGPRPNRKVIATATGEMPHDRIITDAALWHYASWKALLADGTPSDTRIIGEATPRDIPLFEGERVVLLGPPMPGARGWDSTFFTNLHDALRSKVEIVEILSSDEVAIRLQRIGKTTRDSS